MFRLFPKIDVRPLLLSAGLVAGGEMLQSRPPHAQSLEQATLQHLETQTDLECEPESLLWGSDVPNGDFITSQRTALALCRAQPQALRDVFLVQGTFAGESLLHLGAPCNLSETSLSDEGLLRGSGSYAAWIAGDRDRTYRLEVVDLSGEPAAATARWSALSRGQHALTNLQHTGALAGLGRRSFKLDPAGKQVHLRLEARALFLDSDGHESRVDLSHPRHQSRYLLELPRDIALPGNIVTWAVDRVRDLPFVGNEPIQWLKAVAFRARDALDFQDNSDESGDEALLAPTRSSEDDAAAAASDDSAAQISHENGTQWPPERLQTVVFPPLPDEGKWRSLQSDPFVGGTEGLPPPFVTTFLRPDPAYRKARVVFVVWDPRRVQLDFMPGTREPRSPSGEVGRGFIPRAADDIERLVGAFNGGFQTTHGGWGAVADGKTFVPPLPYAATVVRYTDGASGFGVWPADTQPPQDISSARQNLSPLISHGTFNEYGRVWWGGVPIGWKDDAKTVRSGLCQRKDGLIAYVYGSRIDHLRLAKAMTIANCEFGMHLDMNPGHTGFEYYSVSRSHVSLPQEELDPHWKAQRKVPERSDLTYRSRKLFPSMQLMNFPRYIRRQRRDFFYLTERRLLPGERLAGAFPDQWEEGRWKLHGLPQHGFPYAIATTWLRPDADRPETKVRVMKLDLKWLGSTQATSPPQALVLSVPQPVEAVADALQPSVWLGRHRATISPEPPPGPEWQHLASTDPEIGAAWGTSGAEVLVYAEVVTARSPERDRELLRRVLTSAGCDQMLFTRPTRLGVAGLQDLAGHPLPEQVGPSTHLYRVDWQAHRPLFPETPIVPWNVWKPLQP